jgi:hypothetical protein
MVPSYIDTGIFTGDTKQSRFLMPLLHVETVTDAIVAQLLSGYGATIYLPKVAGILPILVCCVLPFGAGMEYMDADIQTRKVYQSGFRRTFM